VTSHRVSAFQLPVCPVVSVLGDTAGCGVVRPRAAMDANRTTAKMSDRRALLLRRLDVPGTRGHALSELDRNWVVVAIRPVIVV